jgi:hypothetical protein
MVCARVFRAATNLSWGRPRGAVKAVTTQNSDTRVKVGGRSGRKRLTPRHHMGLAPGAGATIRGTVPRSLSTVDHGSPCVLLVERGMGRNIGEFRLPGPAAVASSGFATTREKFYCAMSSPHRTRVTRYRASGELPTLLSRVCVWAGRPVVWLRVQVSRTTSQKWAGKQDEANAQLIRLSRKTAVRPTDRCRAAPVSSSNGKGPAEVPR